MSGHRRPRRSPNDDDASSSGSRIHRYHRRSTPTSSKDDGTSDVPGHHRWRSTKRSSGSLSADRSPASRPSWAILNVAGARRDDFHDDDDRTTLAMSCTSKGEMISVSFDLVEPPGISVLALAWPRGPSPVLSTRPEVVAAHRDVILFEMARAHEDLRSTRDAPVDYFVYQASSDDSELPSLSLLPARYDEERCFAGRPVQPVLSKDSTGIISCRSKEDSSSSFVVAQLSITREKVGSPPAIDVSTFQSGSSEWKTFKNLHVHGANGGHDLRWWHTDAVVPDYRRRILIWLDYYRGMILMDMSSQSEKNSPVPRLRYVPLPVETVGDPDHYYHGRGCPANSRSVCATRYGIKFVSVDRQHCSNWGVGHENVLTWNHTFRVTTWSLHKDDYTWRRDGTMYEEEFWATVDSGKKKHFPPRVPPEYPIVDMENPDAVCFQLKKNRCRFEDPKWMIEVDMRKKVLLAATAYSMESNPYGDKHSINSARTVCEDISFSTELPRYLDGGQTCKKRRQ